jgi:dinuclear metal center YbgI/SA1388 family protein
MPAPTSEILAELERVLAPQRFDDYAVNGLQVPGAETVSTVATGVSAHAELFERAAAERADLLLVHHGLFWGTQLFAIDAALKRRLQLLFDAGIALASYHLPLDAHPELGNNALLARALGASELAPFAPHRGETIGVLGTLAGEGVSTAELVERVRASTSRAPLVFDSGPERVRVLAVLTGAGAEHLSEAVAAGADAFITGEPAERVMAEAREARVHFIAAGHYATETFGVRSLGELVARRFGVRHVFLDVPNPV